jgi:hypothetical protein
MKGLDKIRKKYILQYNNRHIGGHETLKDLTFEEYLLLSLKHRDAECSALIEELKKHNPPIVQEIDKLVSDAIAELEKAKEAFKKGKQDFQEEYR